MWEGGLARAEGGALPTIRDTAKRSGKLSVQPKGWVGPSTLAADVGSKGIRTVFCGAARNAVLCRLGWGKEGPEGCPKTGEGVGERVTGAASGGRGEETPSEHGERNVGSPSGKSGPSREPSAREGRGESPNSVAATRTGPPSGESYKRAPHCTAVYDNLSS